MKRRKNRSVSFSLLDYAFMIDEFYIKFIEKNWKDKVVAVPRKWKMVGILKYFENLDKPYETLKNQKIPGEDHFHVIC